MPNYNALDGGPSYPGRKKIGDPRLCKKCDKPIIINREVNGETKTFRHNVRHCKGKLNELRELQLDPSGRLHWKTCKNWDTCGCAVSLKHPHA